MILVKTTDQKIFELEDSHASKSFFITNLKECTTITEPIDILVDSDTFAKVHQFMMKDNHTLKKDYNPLEIYFSTDNLAYISSMQPEDIIRIANAANYLEYPYLLELTCKVIANELSNRTKSELAEIIDGTRKIKNEYAETMREQFDLFEDNI